MDVIVLDELSNKIEELGDMQISAIDEVKSVLDTIVDNVKINNTISKTGVISQKLSYLILENESHGEIEYSTAGTYTWTAPEGVYSIYIIASGAGGGGGGGGYSTSASSYSNYNVSTSGSSGGGAGAVWFGKLNVVAENQYTIVIGAGGAGGAGATKKYNTTYGYIENGTAGKNGNAGGATKFADKIVVGGGSGGLVGYYGYSSDTSPSYNNSFTYPFPSGGGGGTVDANSRKQEHYMIYNGVSGSAGGKGINTNSAVGSAGGSGGAGGVNYIGLSGGKGADGPKSLNAANSYYNSATNVKKLNAAAGGKGSDGYMKIIW